MSFLIRLISPGFIRSKIYGVMMVLYSVTLAAIFLLLEGSSFKSTVIVVGFAAIMGILTWRFSVRIIDEYFDNSQPPHD
jgi:hypothetical protein